MALYECAEDAAAKWLTVLSVSFLMDNFEGKYQSLTVENIKEQN